MIKNAPENSKKQESGDANNANEITRRQAISRGLAFLSALSGFNLTKTAEAKDRFSNQEPLPKGALEFQRILEQIEPNVAHTNTGEPVMIDDIMYEKLPTPDPEKVFGSKTGLIISQRFHRFWLFKDGKLLHHGPLGVANKRKGYKTPAGKFTIIREEGPNYMSKEFPSQGGEPNMPFAVFFTNKGHAVHGSPQAFKQENVPKEKLIMGKEYMMLDRSHGCVNTKVKDAELINKTLKKGDPIVILP